MTKRAYLTIDDSPSADFRAKVRYLCDRRIPAVFFCIGQNLERYGAEAAEAVSLGYHLGNHSYSHPHFSDLGTGEWTREIDGTDGLIDRVYQEAGVPRNHRWFRFPYFDTGGHRSGAEYEAHWSLPRDQWDHFPAADRRAAVQDHLARLGYTQPRFRGIDTRYSSDPTLLTGRDVRCTFDQAEYHRGKPGAPWGLSGDDAILARIDEDFPYEGRSLNCPDTSDIVLVHDHTETTDLFFRIIDRYLEKGIAFQPLE